MTGMPAFDGSFIRSETTMLSSGPNVDASAVIAYKSPGRILLNVTITVGASGISSGDVLFVIPAGFRPAASAEPVYGTLVINSPDKICRVHVSTAGVATAQASATSGQVIRGQIDLPQ